MTLELTKNDGSIVRLKNVSYYSVATVTEIDYEATLYVFREGRHWWDEYYLSSYPCNNEYSYTFIAVDVIA
jgi:hypothetical protein